MTDLQKEMLTARFEQLQKQIEDERGLLEIRKNMVEESENKIEALQMLQRAVDDKLGGIEWGI